MTGSHSIGEGFFAGSPLAFMENGGPKTVRAGRLALAALLLAACTGTIGDTGEPGAANGRRPGSPGSTGSSGTTGQPGAETCQPSAGAPNFHRLNAKQYQETVNALLSTQQTLSQDLPVDSNVYGFDNNADTSLTAAATQKYLDVARSAVTAALGAPAARAKLVPCAIATDASCLKTVLTAWLPRAFRRPVLPQEIDKYASYAKVCTSSPEAGLSCALQAALLSPNFLFRTELTAIPEAATCSEASSLVSTADKVLGQYALASRLSYFLWNGPPDDKLYALAAGGTLNQPDVLAQQVDRMLGADAASHKIGFVQDFPAQWLPLSALETVHPSAQVFPIVRRSAAPGDARRIVDVLLRSAGREPLRARSGEGRLHVRQRAVGEALRHRRRHRDCHAQGRHHRHHPRRHPLASKLPYCHFVDREHIAGAAGEVGAQEPALRRLAAAPAQVGHRLGAHSRSWSRLDQPRVARDPHRA